MFSKRWLLFIVIALLAILVIGCTPKSDSNVAATVNGEDISLEVFEAAVDRMVLGYQQQGFNFEGEAGEVALEEIRQQVINSLIQEEVLLQESKQKGYEASQEAVEEEFEGIKSGFESEEDFKAALELNKFTEESLKNMIANDMQIRAFLENEIQEVDVTEDEIREVYDEYKALWESQNEESEEDTEIPSFEEVKVAIENQIKEDKEQQQFGKIIEELMEKSEIEIFI